MENPSLPYGNHIWSPVFSTCAHMVRVTIITAHISAKFHSCSFRSLPPHGASVCLPGSSFITSSSFLRIRCDGALYRPTHTNGGRRERDRWGPISIPVPGLNPRESRVVTGFFIMQKIFSRNLLQEKFLKEKIPKLLFFYFFQEEINFTRQSVPRACTGLTFSGIFKDLILY